MGFFPFSAFEVENIEDENNHVNIYLKYLGRYKSYIEDKKRNPLADIPISQFGRDINEMGLIKYKFHKFIHFFERISFVIFCILFAIDMLLKYSLTAFDIT